MSHFNNDERDYDMEEQMEILRDDEDERIQVEEREERFLKAHDSDITEITDLNK